MVDGNTRNSLSCDSPMPSPEHSLSAGHNQNGHYRPRSQPQNIRYMHYRENSSYDQNRQYNQHSSGQKMQAGLLQSRQQSQLNPNANSYSLERTTNNSRDRIARSLKCNVQSLLLVLHDQYHFQSGQVYEKKKFPIATRWFQRSLYTAVLFKDMAYYQWLCMFKILSCF